MLKIHLSIDFDSGEMDLESLIEGNCRATRNYIQVGKMRVVDMDYGFQLTPLFNGENAITVLESYGQDKKARVIVIETVVDGGVHILGEFTIKDTKEKPYHSVLADMLSEYLNRLDTVEAVRSKKQWISDIFKDS